jgi:hypothetical protein
MANKRKFRITINTLTSWGASVVIIGVMAKLLRWHAADTLIIVGMLTEAILFFILGFQSDEIKIIKEEDDVLVTHDNLATVPNNIKPVIHNQTADFIAPNVQTYQEEMDKLAAHIKNLNAAYDSMSTDLENVEVMAIHTTRVKEETEKLAKNLTALNAVYRNMLSAMNMPNA